jgi:hypothetical protein
MDAVRVSRRPGVDDPWWFLSAPGFVVALPADANERVLSDLTALAEGERDGRTIADRSIEELVSAIPHGGPDGLRAFAVIVAAAPSDGDGVPVSAIVHGDIAVDVYSVGGSRRFTDREIRPWLLADFQAVTAVVVHDQLAPVAPLEEVGLGEPVCGQATGARLDWVELTLAGRPYPPPPAHLAEARPPAAGSAVTDAASAPLPPAPQASVEDTVITPRTADAATVIMLPRREGGAEGVADPLGDDVDHEPAHLATRLEYSFAIGGAAALPLDAVYIIGRRPRAPRVAVPGEKVRLIAVPSPTQEISSAHVELRRHGEAVVVTDLRSTNGTVLVPPQSGRLRLRPGESRVVLPGTAVHIGDGTIITISATESVPTAAQPEASTDTLRRPFT